MYVYIIIMWVYCFGCWKNTGHCCGGWRVVVVTISLYIPIFTHDTVHPITTVVLSLYNILCIQGPIR